jgi:bacillithiol biosynthesis deacetylase BshB1
VVTDCDVLAVGAHPDDVELGCGGLLASLEAGARVVGIVDLTAGETGTRGDVAIRRREADAARAALGVTWRACLELPDGGLDAGDGKQLAAVVAAVRTARPRAVLLHHRDDPHPDHRAAAELTARACFLATLSRWKEELGEAHRPRLLLAYPGPRQLFEPDIVVDVSGVYQAKRAALASHASQFSAAAGAPTHVASGHFLAAVEGRDRAAGNTIGSELGEGLAVLGPIPADEIVWLLGGRE